MTNGPDYLALLKLLPILPNWVDSTGEVTLTTEGAGRMRALGFTTAQAGRWKIPRVPYEFVAGTFFEYLAHGSDAPPSDDCRPLPQRAAVETILLPPASRVELETPLLDLRFVTPPVVSPRRFEPAVQDHPRPEPPASEKPSKTVEAREAEKARRAEVVMVAQKIRKAVRKAGGRLARRRTQQRLSRHTARIFNDALGELVARGLVVVEGAMIVTVAGVMQAFSGAPRASPEKRALT